MQILNNPWVIGIGGGILSGFIVTFVSRAILSRRDRREYNQKVLSANREIIYAIRPGISEGHIPDNGVAEALMKATARKYGVDSKDLYTPPEIAQELTKEVMDSSFISSKTKGEYCAKLSTLSPVCSEDNVNELVKSDGDRSLKGSSGIEDYRSRMVTMMSMMMGILAAMMTGVLAFTKSELVDNSLSGFKDKGAILVPMLMSLLATMIAVSMTTVFREFRKRSERDAIDKNKGIIPEVSKKRTPVPIRRITNHSLQSGDSTLNSGAK